MAKDITGDSAICKKLPWMMLVFIAVCMMAMPFSFAQERPFPQDYNTYDDYRDFAQATEPASGQAVPVQEDDADALSIDELDALLPAHLRAPLPTGDMPEKTPVRKIIAANKIAPASPIEEFFRKATGDQSLSQFGYDFFTAAAQPTQPPIGEVQGDYVLGIGDRVTVMFLGERKDRNTYVVARNGALAVDLLPSVAAAGKSLDALRSDLQHLLDVQGYHGEIFVSLENIRQIAVLVAGHVKTPGRRVMTPLQSVLEALSAAGGVSKTGSLRQIRVVRGGESIPVDLYGMMGAGGKGRDLPVLQDGDRIIVPPLGPTIAIAGDVRQPAIYELSAKSSMDVAGAISLAGGVMSRGQNRITLLAPQSDGNRISTEVSLSSGMRLSDGAVLQINRSIDKPAQTFTLSGEVNNPGAYPMSSYKNLSQLLRAPQMFGDDVYPLLGVVSRKRSTDLARDLLGFSPQDVFMGRSDLPIQDGDQVYMLSRSDVVKVMNKDKIDLPPLVATFVREHGVSIQGAVRLPGNWPVAGPLPVSRILDVAGGALTDADLSRAEILRNDVGFIEASSGAVSRRDIVDITDANISTITLTFGDGIRIPDRFEAVTRQSVTIAGEVRNPGTYDLMRGDTLLTLIDRAGGMTDQAYPLGAVFSRASERKREKEKFSSAARDLERSIAMAVDNEDGKVDMAQMALAKELVDELKTIEPAGRITVEADPGILRQDPAQDILLEAGDRIYMPKRPLTVRVTGEVLSPAALQFRSDKNTGDYLAEAGGVTYHADKGRMFVLYPNGSAQPVNANSWTRFKPVMITPGSTIVVPRDPKPFSFIDSAKDITQILSNLAITGIYAEDLVDRN